MCEIPPRFIRGDIFLE